ncbi:hypothetical protein NIES2111_26170 [Nostoc sp. NIES-2111]|nr:hypothetical protein NIES2111_26170 [Nostoc sp. NIES-2111]
MSKVERFEDLIAWQKARSLTKHIYQVTQEGDFAKDFGLARQIQISAVSIMSNIAEGFERTHLGEFYQFLSISKSSCAELRSQIYVALDIGYLEKDKFNQLLYEAEEVARIVGGLRISINKQKQQNNSKLKTQ